MVGFYSDPVANPVGEAQGSDAIASTPFEGQDWFGLPRQVGREIGNYTAEYGVYDPELGQQMAPPEPTMPAAQANAQYGIPGKLTFPNDVPESVAQSMYDAKREQLQRQDAAARTPDNFWSGAGRIGAGLTVGALDPLNIAASFLPVIGEARVAGMLARAGIGGLGEDVVANVAEQGAAAIPNLGARTAVRAITGMAAGGTAQVPLVGLRYALSRQEQADYSATDAMADIGMGTLLGGGLHTVIGGAGDVLGTRFGASRAAALVEDDPVAREAALRASVAAVAEDRPVEVAPLLDLADAQKQREAAWYQYGLENEGYRADLAALPEGPLPDEVTQSRLDSIDQDLADPAMAGRRDDLLAERQMLTEGAAPTPEADDLDVARTEAQRQGLSAAIARNEARISDLEQQITGSESARRAAGGAAPDDALVSQQADAAAKLPPAVQPAVPPDRTAALEDFINRTRAAGALDADHEAELSRIEEQGQRSQSWTQALGQAAACLMRGAI